MQNSKAVRRILREGYRSKLSKKKPNYQNQPRELGKDLKKHNHDRKCSKSISKRLKSYINSHNNQKLNKSYSLNRKNHFEGNNLLKRRKSSLSKPERPKDNLSVSATSCKNSKYKSFYSCKSWGERRNSISSNKEKIIKSSQKKESNREISECEDPKNLEKPIGVFTVNLVDLEESLNKSKPIKKKNIFRNKKTNKSENYKRNFINEIEKESNIELTREILNSPDFDSQKKKAPKSFVEKIRKHSSDKRNVKSEIETNQNPSPIYNVPKSPTTDDSNYFTFHRVYDSTVITTEDLIRKEQSKNKNISLKEKIKNLITASLKKSEKQNNELLLEKYRNSQNLNILYNDDSKVKPENLFAHSYQNSKSEETENDDETNLIKKFEASFKDIHDFDQAFSTDSDLEQINDSTTNERDPSTSRILKQPALDLSFTKVSSSFANDSLITKNSNFFFYKLKTNLFWEKAFSAILLLNTLTLLQRNQLIMITL